MLKRLFDIVLALIGIILFLPFLPFVAFFIMVGSKGPVFTHKDFIGKNGKTIALFRFHTLINETDYQHLNRRLIKFSGIGKFLYLTGLDGWPLLFNVLKGDLSIIGPRPEPKNLVEKYSKDQKTVLAVRPGIWGPYSNVNDVDHNEFEHSPLSWSEYYEKYVLPEKLYTELKYVHSQGLSKDFRVMLGNINLFLKRRVFDQLMQDAKSNNFLAPMDIVLFFFSYFVAFQLRFEGDVPTNEYTLFIYSMPIVLVTRVLFFYYFGVYKNLLKYVGVRDLVGIISATTVSTVFIIVAQYFFGFSEHSRSIFLIDWILCIALTGGLRLFLRMLNESVDDENAIRTTALIIGAGDLGEMVLRMMDRRGQYHVVGIIDDDRTKIGRTIRGVKVVGQVSDIPQLVPIFRVDEVLIAIEKLSSEEMKNIVSACKQVGVKHRIVPAVNDVLSGSVHLSRFREVEISDLFGRDPVSLDLTAIRAFIRGKRVMITGAGGSIGSELCRQICDYGPESVTLVDKNENYLHEIRCELEAVHPELDIQPSLCNITNKAKLEQIFEKTQPEVIFHAAAHKHVPLCEENPEEATWNNVYGTKTLALMADQFNVQHFVMVSTDKAVNPTSVMGCTKRVAEKFVQTLSQKSNTVFVTVRFGNVLNSNGSVVPTFMRQIEKGGPITITHPNIERFFMSIPEAVQLILQAVTMGKSGQIFILEMGKSILILDLAIELINQAGYRPFKDVPIKFVGLRPGEKLYEELVGKFEEAVPTAHSSIQILKSNQSEEQFDYESRMTPLFEMECTSDRKKLTTVLKDLVPEYTPFEEQEVFQSGGGAESIKNSLPNTENQEDQDSEEEDSSSAPKHQNGVQKKDNNTKNQPLIKT